MKVPGKDYIGLGVGAMILNDQRQLLLLKRSSNARNRANVWMKPGGTVEQGETVESAVKREIMEELGIAIQVTNFLGYTEEILQEEGQHWLALDFLAVYVSGTVCNAEPHKHTEVEWHSLEQLPWPLAENTAKYVLYLQQKKDRVR